MNCIFIDTFSCPTPDKNCAGSGCANYLKALDLAGDSELAAKVEADRRDGLARLADGNREILKHPRSGAVDWRG